MAAGLIAVLTRKTNTTLSSTDKGHLHTIIQWWSKIVGCYIRKYLTKNDITS